MRKMNIYFEKGKLIILIPYALLFILLGIWLVSDFSSFILNYRRWNSPNGKILLGILSIVVGLLGIFHMGKCYITKNPAVKIDEIGIMNNSSAFKKRTVKWEEIQSIEIKKHKLSFLSLSVIRINLKNPNKSPLEIDTNKLKITREELFQILQFNVHK
jgi:uncharacterized integral membrane protein